MASFTGDDRPSIFAPSALRFATEWADCWPGADRWHVEIDRENEAGELAQIFAPCALDPSYMVTALAGGVLLERADCSGIVGAFPDLRSALLAIWSPPPSALLGLDQLAVMESGPMSGLAGDYAA